MECEICQRRPDKDGIAIHRINEKGIPGIWRCEDHMEGRKVDKAVQDIIDTIREKK